MNERIRQLAEQAGFTYIRDEGIGWAGNHNSSLPKFALLIVRECIDTVSDCSVEYCTRPQIVSEIKQHFGVEA